MGKRPRAPSPRRYRYTPELLAHGRHRYEHTTDSIPDIAVEFGIHKTTLQRLAAREGWVRYTAPPRDVSAATKLAERAAALEASTLPPRSGGEGRFVARERDEPGWGVKETSPPDPSPPSAVPTGGGEKSAPSGGGENAAATAVDIAAEIAALLAEVRREREIVGAERAKLKHLPQSPIDAERSSRAYAQFTATMHRLLRLQAGHIDITPEDLIHDRQHNNDHAASDIDARRDALARRIEAFMESRTDEECGLGPDGQRIE